MTKKLAIVDPYFSGAPLRYVAESLGYEVIAIQSNAKAIMPPPKDPFRFVYDDQIDTLRKWQPAALFAGTENGVLLADELSEKLNLLSNGTKLSLARRDKAAMKEVFCEKQIPCAKFTRFQEVEELREWMKNERLSFPIVVKPQMAFGSINVSICRSARELVVACKLLKNQDLTPFGIENSGYLAEEFIPGEEYAIDLIGNGQRHFITDIWLYERREFSRGRNAYVSANLVDPKEESELVEKLAEISVRAVQALGIRYGCAQVEVKVNSSHISVLEVGARIAGAGLVHHAAKVTGQDVERAHIEAFLGIDFIFKPIYQLNAYTIVVFLTNQSTGAIREICGLKDIQQLPSFQEFFLKVQLGDFVSPTVDLVGSPGTVLLRSSSKKQIEQDARLCHELFRLKT